MGFFRFIVSRVLVVTLLAFTLQAPVAWAQDEDLAKDSSTEINVKNADIAAIVRIFSKKTKRNYILDEKVSGKVSIYLPGRVSTEESIRILDSVLALKGFTSVPIGENLWKIVPAAEAKTSTIPTLTSSRGGTPSAAMVTRLVNLKFVVADDMQKLLSPLISPQGLINAYTGTNSLIVIDSEDNIERLLRLVNEMDVPFTDREMTIIPISHADAPDIAEKLTEILSDNESGDSGSSAGLEAVRSRLRDNNAKGGTPAAATAGASTVSARAREPKIIADERTNSIIVVADDETTARIRALISQLDSEVDRSGNRFYVYRCQHASAEELADVLSGLTGEGGSRTNTSSSSSSSSNSSSSDESSSNSRNRLARQRRTPGQSRTSSSDSGGVSSVSFGEDLSITADPATNSLIINGSRTDYMKIKSLLEELDIKRRQVLVEAMLLEVGVNDSKILATDFLASGGGADGGVVAQSNFGNLAQLVADPTQLSNFSIAAASSGTLTLPGDITIPTQSVLLTAASTNSNVNVLSAPTILATDNEEAEIVVGQNVPFLASTSTSTDNLNNTFNQIDRQDVGITLRITPQISSQAFVTLQIFTEVSDVIDATASSELGPTTTVRTSETTVVAKDGQMVVIGGLMSDDSSEAEDGVPFLKDVPLLGHLFKQHSDNRSRTNLLIFITPRIIRDQFDLREQTIDRRDVMKGEVAHRDIYPDREEVLNNKNIDDVIEGTPYDGPGPGTIRPATKSSAGKISLHAAPKLPGSQTLSSTELNARASLRPASPRAAENPSTELFLVLERNGSTATQASLPFSMTSEGRIGLILPADSAASAAGFFRAGERYAYNADGKEILFSLSGSFRSADDAQILFNGDRKDWYTLSPHELMNLGKGPWVRK